MAYSNVAPPALPNYDAIACPYYILEFEYDKGAEDWNSVTLRLSATPFTYTGVAVTNVGEHHIYTYGSGTREWLYWSIIPGGEMAIAPGITSTGSYIRIWTNHDILDGTGNEIWLAENTVTPVETEKFPIKDFLNGLVMALCGRAVQWPKREPVAYLYGTPSESGNIGLRFGDSVTYYDGVVMPAIPDAIKAYRYQMMCVLSSGYKNLVGFSVAPETREFSYGGLFPSTDVRNGQFQEAPYYQQTASANQTEWSPDAAFVGTGTTDFSLEDIKWANYDVLNLDGSVYLAASDPIPVSGIVDYIDDIPIYE